MTPTQSSAAIDPQRLAEAIFAAECGRGPSGTLKQTQLWKERLKEACLIVAIYEGGP